MTDNSKKGPMSNELSNGKRQNLVASRKERKLAIGE